MIPEKIKQIPNPYFQMTPQLPSSDFVGREDELSKLKSILDDYQRTMFLKNVVITGVRSIGKSTLLHRIKQILENYNFIVYEIEFPRDPSTDINDFEFFKDLFKELFIKYSPPEGSFFDSKQSEIWFSLTQGNYEHNSDFKDRKLGFASQYASYKNGKKEILSYKQIENDFKIILDELISPEGGIEGFAILLDEFQELSKNTNLLDILRQLSEKLTGLILVGAGLPGFLGTTTFEKINRISVPINIRGMSREDILNLVFKPLEKTSGYPKHEVSQWFDRESLYEIVNRSNGNPLHIKVLCWQMFEYFQKSGCKLIELNKSVMEGVMEYYSTISEKSGKIRRAMEACTRGQLISFGKLYEFEGFSIRSAIHLEMAFDPIISEQEEIIRNKILNAFEEVWDLGLFEFKNNEISLDQLRSSSLNMLSQIEYKFIGDTLDKLYAAYYFRELTQTELKQNQGRDFEDILAIKLSFYLDKIIENQNIPEAVGIRMDFPVRIVNAQDDSEFNESTLYKNINSLISASVKETIKDDKKHEILEISRKHGLDFAAKFAFILQLIGYYIVIADVIIKGKRRWIYKFFPITKEVIPALEIQTKINEKIIGSLSLNDYMIKICSINIFTLFRASFEVINSVDKNNETEILIKEVRRRDFPTAVDRALKIMNLSKRYGDNEMVVSAETCNNYGFCLINVNSLSHAMDELKLCKDKLLISRLNIAYLKFLRGDPLEAKKDLSKVIRKNLGTDEYANFMHLTIYHARLPFENRIVEDVLLFNVAIWNWCLLTAQTNGEIGLINNFLKKVKPKGNENLIDKRVRNWIDYYQERKEYAKSSSINLLQECLSIEYLKHDLKMDITIFESEIKDDFLKKTIS